MLSDAFVLKLNHIKKVSSHVENIYHVCLFNSIKCFLLYLMRKIYFFLNNKFLNIKPNSLNWDKLHLMTRFNLLTFCLIFLSSCLWEIIFFSYYVLFRWYYDELWQLIKWEKCTFSLLSESTFSSPKCFVQHKDNRAWSFFCQMFLNYEFIIF